jgi:tetratricopeptide (TPR) repeat protein
MSETGPFTLGAFELQERVAAGGMGEVWRAVHTPSRGSAAVKVLAADLVDEAHARASLRAELRAVVGLDHPNIVFVFGTGEVTSAAAAASAGRLRAGAAWIAMEFAEGGTLRDRAGGMSWASVQAALLDVLAGLAHAHSRGLIHGDVKPANLLVGGARGGVKLGDFGIARPVERDPLVVAGRTTWGSPAYMAPEQLREGWAPVGPWTDLYALGCTAWTLLTGAPPFAGDPKRVVERHLSAPLPPFIPTHALPEGAESWLRRLLVKDPALRTRHAADARRSLAVLPQEGDTTQRHRAPPRAAGSAEVTQPVLAPRAAVRLRPEAVPFVGADLPAEFPARPIARAGGAARHPAVGLELLALRSFPVVGREVEQALLWARLREVAEEGEARAVVLRGPSGVGTSRLARWLSESAAEMGLCRPMVAWYGSPAGSARGLRGAFHRAMRLGRLTRDGAAGALAAAAPALDPQDRAALAAWLLGGGRQAPVPRAERLSLWRRVLAALISSPPPTGEGRPLVFWIDAVEAGSADALALVRSMVGGRLPVLFVVTVVDELLPGRSLERALLEELREQRGVEELRIAALAPPACRRLLEEGLGLDPAFAEVVGQRTSGNPLFIMQLLGDCVQRRLLEVTAHGVRPAAGARLVLPADLERVWVERVEAAAAGLPDDEVQSVELLAVLGDPADELEWTSACAALGVVPGIELVERLEGEGLLARPSGETAWRFVHAMFREALERRAARAGRLDACHRACASMLSRFGDRAHAERVGRHLLAAGDLGGSLLPLGEAIEDRVLAREAGPAEVLLALRADALGRAGVGEHDARAGQQRFLDTLLAQLHNDLPRAEAGLAALRADIARHGWPGVGARASWLAGRIARRRGQVAEACAQLEEAVRAGTAAGDVRMVARARADRGDALQELGEAPRAAAEYEAARPLFEQLDDPAGLGEIHLGLAQVSFRAGHYADATVHLRYAVQSFGRIGHRVGLARTLNQRGDVHRFSGELDAAAEDYRASVRMLEATNNWLAVIPHVNLGLLLLTQGRYEPARAQLRHALPELGRHGAREAEVCARLGVCVAGARLGQVQEGAAMRVALGDLLTDPLLQDPEVTDLVARYREAAAEAGDEAALEWLASIGG